MGIQIYDSDDLKGAYKQGRVDVLDELQSLIDCEYYDGGYGDYHEVYMIAKMIEELKEQK